MVTTIFDEIQRLPVDIQSHIYSFDSTYIDKLRHDMFDSSTWTRLSFRLYFYMDRFCSVRNFREGPARCVLTSPYSSSVMVYGSQRPAIATLFRIESFKKILSSSS